MDAVVDLGRRARPSQLQCKLLAGAPALLAQLLLAVLAFASLVYKRRGPFLAPPIRSSPRSSPQDHLSDNCLTCPNGQFHFAAVELTKWATAGGSSSGVGPSMFSSRAQCRAVEVMSPVACWGRSWGPGIGSAPRGHTRYGRWTSASRSSPPVQGMSAVSRHPATAFA